MEEGALAAAVFLGQRVASVRLDQLLAMRRAIQGPDPRPLTLGDSGSWPRSPERVWIVWGSLTANPHNYPVLTRQSVFLS